MGVAKVYGYKCDVANREEVFKVAEKVKQDVGNVTILINNAGIMPCHTFLDHSPEEIKRMFDVNVMAHFWTLQAFLPSMIQNNHGHIVALSSVAGFVGLPNLVPYCVSKYAVRGLMESLDEELRRSSKDKPSKIKFTTICPYMVDTGLCKKPRMRFPSIMSLAVPKMVADEIVRMQRRNIKQVSIPKFLIHLDHVVRCLPDMCVPAVLDFVNAGVEPDS
nr:short-chain dehydrogenase/reductase family 16C member 6-like [Nomia melanderi]